MNNTKPYYLDQSGWTSNDYYSLHRYLHRMMTHSDRKKAEIESLDTSLMSERTKVLLYCIIKYYHLDEMFGFSNLSSLVDQKPLDERLVLGDHGLKEENVYYKMNVIF
ncbi:MAG: hypothetical protein IJ571_00835 [Ruminococcus sp.]|nr:hypothetical protein [Ruminococcus sp.]